MVELMETEKPQVVLRRKHTALSAADRLNLRASGELAKASVGQEPLQNPHVQVHQLPERPGKTGNDSPGSQFLAGVDENIEIAEGTQRRVGVETRQGPALEEDGHQPCRVEMQKDVL